MYNAYFGFGKRPFASVPDADQYFPAAAIEAARQTLTRCIQRGEGIGVVVGPSGTGKTLLCHVLAEQFRDSFRVAVLSSGRLSNRRNLLQAILYELGRPYRRMDEGELRLALCDYLSGGEDCPQGVVLLVDEAHAMPLRLLEELRMLTNLAYDGQPRLRLVLAGDAGLEERLASPRLESLTQRLVARCYLEALSRVETQTYIHVQIDSAGARGEAIFSEDTCRSVYQATDGVPRLINQVCDHALLLAYVRGAHQIEPSDVEEAWADLQQLPTPWTADGSGPDHSSEVIEFGRLDDSTGDEAPKQDAPSAAPRGLRILHETDGTESLGGDTQGQLDRIEGMLDEAEEDFRPAGSIRPEVELVFDDAEVLLREPYEEEEVVADRYATPSGPEQAAEEERPHGSSEVARCVTQDTREPRVPPLSRALQESAAEGARASGGGRRRGPLPRERGGGSCDAADRARSQTRVRPIIRQAPPGRAGRVVSREVYQP